MKRKERNRLPAPAAIASGVALLFLTAATLVILGVTTAGNALLIAWFSSSIFATAADGLIKKRRKRRQAQTRATQGFTEQVVAEIKNAGAEVARAPTIRPDAPERFTF